MKSKLVFILLILTVNGLFSSCEKDSSHLKKNNKAENLQNNVNDLSKASTPNIMSTTNGVIFEEGNNITNELLSNIGVSSINRITLNGKLQQALVENGIKIERYDMNNSWELKDIWNPDQFGLIIRSLNDPNEYLTVTISINTEDNSYFFIKQSKVKSVFNGGILSGFEYRWGDGGNEVVKFVQITGSPEPNERNLGARRTGESFRDCFERNWDNFGTDLPSKLAQATNPWAVAAAIAIICSTTASATH